MSQSLPRPSTISERDSANFFPMSAPGGYTSTRQASPASALGLDDLNLRDPGLPLAHRKRATLLQDQSKAGSPLSMWAAGLPTGLGSIAGPRAGRQFAYHRGVPAQSFSFPGDRRGVLCIHGFTGTPYEMRYLGEQLAAGGFSVEGPALPGHATRIDDLRDKTWRDWADATLAAYDALAARCDQVAVVGQSLGGLLTLYLATQRKPAAIASLAAPLWLEGLGGWVARAVTRGPLAGRIKTLPKLGGSDVRDPTARRENPCYRGFPVAALGQLCAFMEVVDAALPEVTVPTLILHATQDHTAPVASAHRLAARVAGPTRIRILPASYHLIAIDVERTVVAAEVAAWCGQHLGPAVAASA
ncbi:MAG: alpha/beta fold hydrolase [Kofleriaceae bacterium]